MSRIRAATGRRETRLEDGWRLSVSDAGACDGPADAARLQDWIPGRAPGTTAQALLEAGLWPPQAPPSLHDKDVWWRRPLPDAGPATLAFDGLATLAEVWIGGDRVLASENMFQPHEIACPPGSGAELWICFRALAPRLAARGPRARWRPFMIERQGLRLVRTTLLGHMSGWTPAIDIVGPWRPVRLIEEAPVRARDARIAADWDGDGARLAVEVTLEGHHAPLLRCAGATLPMEAVGEDRFRAELRPKAEPWFPHTHGAQPLYPVEIACGEAVIDLGRTGFRRIEVDAGADGKGFGLVVNGRPVFCRGAGWVHPDPMRLGGERAFYEPRLRLARGAGMNMLRVAGVGVYESPDFFDLCDELGILVWQDFMFANFDYPADEAFLGACRAEAEAFLASLQGAPSLAVLCGGSEVMQQAAMMGLDAAALDWPLFDEVLADACARLRPDVAYVCNSPSGGALPFSADAGVGHYYGVGAYERPLEDARRANVRFASECLAFANVPQPETLAAGFSVPAVHDPRWKARTPRDRGASWDFEDVRDHYLGRLFGVDPQRLRREYPGLYLDLSRAASALPMASAFAEWRRPGSSCRGGLVWLFQDFEIGAGWGLVDATGEPKPAWFALRRTLQPVQVLMTDEGVNGLALHLLNETDEPIEATLRLAVFGATPGPILEVGRELALAPRSAQTLSAFEIIGRFFDLTYAYRFGPRSHEAVFAQLLAADGALISQAFYMPPGAGFCDGGGTVEARIEGGGGDWRLTLTAERFQPYVHVSDRGFRPDDDGFPLAPGEPRTLRLSRREQALADAAPQGEVLAIGGRLVCGYGGR